MHQSFDGGDWPDWVDRVHEDLFHKVHPGNLSKAAVQDAIDFLLMTEIDYLPCPGVTVSKKQIIFTFHYGNCSLIVKMCGTAHATCRIMKGNKQDQETLLNVVQFRNILSELFPKVKERFLTGNLI
jgi:hypothetical protein